MDLNKSKKLTGKEWTELKRKKRILKKKRLEEKLAKKMKQDEEAKKKESEVPQDEEKEQSRDWTVSVAVPGSILSNAQSPELRTYLAGQIARAVVVFNVDEVIVFDESGTSMNDTDTFQGITNKGNPNIQLARILQYLECPQYLRKHFFPKHVDLQYAGLLNPLDCPHHLRMQEWCKYREGVVVKRPVSKDHPGSYVNIGMLKEARVDKELSPGIRVTVKLKQNEQNDKLKYYSGQVVSPSLPRSEAGLYWGYTVRLAPSLGAVFTQSPYPNGYDKTIGTSDKGANIDEFKLPKFNHLLVVLGGLKGLESALDVDSDLNVDDPCHLFDYYLNTCPKQGSRTIRTEEALLITLSGLRSKICESTSLNL
ncbi:putative methyltransferase C9orf114 [Anneissia japonica]|uniref:putative methyltransferase C9orf114 n=1 Tax=Anneissia japonica TaxID=1529436 RepID=UPI0014257CB1|nr:putative methyltransferase C9orf114 [Anneissia japonica]XP_033114816.1 putative methyltransferase C9orf114 [Anneissia japonica]